MSLEDELVERGFARVALPDSSPVHAARDAVRAALGFDLEGYIAADAEHLAIHTKLVVMTRAAQTAASIVMANRGLFALLFGPDLSVDQRVHFRIARPRRYEDNVGFHCDTWYGETANSLTVHVPLMDLPPEGALRFGPGTHRMTADDLGVVDRPPQCERGSVEHDIGFLYAPKKVTSVEVLESMVPVPLKLGDAVLFSPATLHGQEINRMPRARFSIDLRVINTFAVREGRKTFAPVCQGPVGRLGAAQQEVQRSRAA